MKSMLAVPLIALIMISSAISQDPVAPKSTRLSGKLRVDGKPLEEGRILFYSRDGQITGCIIKSGKYTVANPNVGEQNVTIDGQNVPKRYSEFDKSGLVCDIAQDINNQLDFDLSSK